jgi:hypothetical protein
MYCTCDPLLAVVRIFQFSGANWHNIREHLPDYSKLVALVDVPDGERVCLIELVTCFVAAKP